MDLETRILNTIKTITCLQRHNRLPNNHYIHSNQTNNQKEQLDKVEENTMRGSRGEKVREKP